jgi:manganese/iron transport system substrate-binding protein
MWLLPNFKRIPTPFAQVGVAIGLVCAAMGWAQVKNGLAQEPSTKRLLLVCSTTQVADFARQVVGDRCDVRCILAPGADPHLYEPKPSDARLVSTADLCLENGLHLEGKDWMRTLADDAGKPLTTCADGVKSLDLKTGDQVVRDPHAWFSPKNAALYVNNISAAVSRLDPAGQPDYEARAALYLDQLRALHLWIERQVSRIPPRQRVLVTSHDAFNYFCHDYGFTAAAPTGWSTGQEIGAGMTPERRRKSVESIREFQVPAIFVETSVNPKLIREIADEAGVKVGGLLYSDSMGPSGSAGETYLGMMRENVLTIVGALLPARSPPPASDAAGGAAPAAARES